MFTDILKQKWVIPTVAGVASLAVGFAGGYIVGSKKNNDDWETLEEKPNIMYDQDMEDELLEEEVIEYNESSVVDFSDEDVVITINNEPINQLLSDQELIQIAYDKAVSEANEDLSDEEQEKERVHIITQPPSIDWDEEVEQASRVEGEPYIISQEAFIANETEYAQETLTYYAGDDIMADQMENPIYGYAGLMGDLNFGYGSGDANVVYIRNDGIRREWEILRHTGHYAVEVKGLEIEHEYEKADLKHSNDRKFRDD